MYTCSIGIRDPFVNFCSPRAKRRITFLTFLFSQKALSFKSSNNRIKNTKRVIKIIEKSIYLFFTILPLELTKQIMNLFINRWANAHIMQSDQDRFVIRILLCVTELFAIEKRRSNRTQMCNVYRI